MPEEKYKKVIIVGPDKEGRVDMTDFDVLKSREYGDKLCIIGDSFDYISSYELENLRGRIAENADIYIMGHGNVSASKKAHTIDIIRGTEKTSDVIQKLEEYSPQCVNYHIYSCFGGAVISDLSDGDLQAGVTVTAHAEPDNKVSIALSLQLAKESVEKALEQNAPPTHGMQPFLDNLWKEVQTSTISYQGEQGTFTYAFRPPLKQIIGEDANREFLEWSARNFIEKLKEYDPQLAATLDLKVPEFTKDQIDHFRKKIFKLRLQSLRSDALEYLEEVANNHDPNHQWKKDAISELCDKALWKTLSTKYYNFRTHQTKNLILNLLKIHNNPPIQEFNYLILDDRKTLEAMFEKKIDLSKLYQDFVERMDINQGILYCFLENGMDPNIQSKDGGFLLDRLQRNGVITNKEEFLVKVDQMKAEKTAREESTKIAQEEAREKELEAKIQAKEDARSKQKAEANKQKAPITVPTIRIQKPEPAITENDELNALKEELLRNVERLKQLNEKCSFIKDESLESLKKAVEELDKKPNEFEKAANKAKEEFEQKSSIKKNKSLALKYKFKQILNYMILRIKQGKRMGDKAGKAKARVQNSGKARNFTDKLLEAQRGINTSKAK